MGGLLKMVPMKCITLRRLLVLFIVLIHCMMLFIIFHAIKMKYFQHASHGDSSISRGLNVVKTLRHSALAKERNDTLRISDSHTSINREIKPPDLVESASKGDSEIKTKKANTTSEQPKQDILNKEQTSKQKEKENVFFKETQQKISNSFSTKNETQNSSNKNFQKKDDSTSSRHTKEANLSKETQQELDNISEHKQEKSSRSSKTDLKSSDKRDSAGRKKTKQKNEKYRSNKPSEKESKASKQSNEDANLKKTQRENEEAESSNKKAAQKIPGTGNLPSTKPIVKPTVRPSKCNRCFNSTFPILMDQPHVCQSHNTQNQIDVVFFIVSAVTHFQNRQAIRQTWATVTHNNTGSVRHVFMVGDTPNALHAKELREEGGKFRDVVMHGFLDSYANLTLKILSSLRWVAHQCKQSRFFMKVDNDVWINTPVVLGLLKNHSDFLQNGIGGRCRDNIYANRKKNSKWYVPEYLHPKPKYPPYCLGHAYAGSVKVAQQVVQVSPDIPFFYLEDVYLGMCLERLGYKVHTFPRFKNFSNDVRCKLARGSDLPTIVNVSPKKMRDYWNETCGMA